MSSSVRKAAVAGTWYPQSADAVRREVDRYLDAAGAPKLAGRLVALVSPHAGLRYSGPVAAWGYALLRGTAERTVVLVGPSHHAAFTGVALHAHGAWETPLGRVPIDEALCEAVLAAGKDVVFDEPGVHRREHSLEMQMPFLQRLVPSLRIVPLLMGSQSAAEVAALARALGRALAGRDVLLVASSDLSHYLAASEANARDALLAEEVGRYDDESLMSRLQAHDNVACGGGPIVAVMRAARALGADRASVLRYADSGDVAGDKTQVVGYLSAALRASRA